MKNVQKFCFDKWVDCQVWGYPLNVNSYQFESDGRKVKSVMRNLVEQGYLSQTANVFTATNKAFVEVSEEGVNFFEAWDKDRKDGWNKKSLPYIRFKDLTDGQKKFVLANAISYEWYVLYSGVTQYGNEMTPGMLQGPAQPGDDLLDLKVKGQEEIQRRGSEWDVVISTSGLRDYVKETLAEEHFSKLFVHNLRWGLVTAGFVGEEDSKIFSSSEDPDWVLGGGSYGNLGNIPEQWGDNLKAKIAEVDECIQRHKKRLVVMKAVQEGVEKAGGWDAFLTTMKAKMQEELSKK
jgi:hypothetical protein